MEYWLKCRVSPGQFSVEYAIQGVAFDGTRFSLFAPQESVETESEPTGSEPVQGVLKVDVVQSENGKTLIRLPREAFEAGYFVTVGSANLETRPTRQPV